LFDSRLSIIHQIILIIDLCLKTLPCSLTLLVIE